MVERVEELKKEISEIQTMIDICKERKYSKNILFVLTAMYIKRKETLEELES